MPSATPSPIRDHAPAAVPPANAWHLTVDNGKSAIRNPKSEITFHTLRDDAALARIAPDWSRLAQADDTALFRTPEWIECWRATLAPGIEPRVVAGWNADGRLLCLWPLGLVRRGNALFSWRSLEPMGASSASGDRLEPLGMAQASARNESRTEIYRPTHGAWPANRGFAASRPSDSPLLIELRRAAIDADVLALGELSAAHPIIPALQSSAMARDAALSDHRTLPCLNLPADWHALASTLSSKLVSHVTRSERAALTRQGMIWRLNAENESLESALQGFMSVHQDRWQARGHAGNFAKGGLPAFVRAFAHVASRRGWLRLHRLCDGAKTVAALLAFHFGRRAYYYQSGWDPAAASLSPGSLCIARAIRTAIDEGLTTFDFLRGDEPYKRRWCNGADQTLTLAAPLTLTGRMLFRSRRTREIVKRAVGPRVWSRLRRLSTGAVA